MNAPNRFEVPTPALGPLLQRTQWLADEIAALGPALQMDCENLKAAHATGNADLLAKCALEASRRIEQVRKMLEPFLANIEDEPAFKAALDKLRGIVRCL